jgi:hypothetical protein
MKPPMSRNRLHSFTLVVALVLLCVNVLLLHQNSVLAARTAKLRSERGPQPGSVLPSIAGQTVTGTSVTVDYTTRTGKSLVLVMSPLCAATKENWGNWREILSADRPNSRNFLVVDLSDRLEPRHLAQYGLRETDVVTKVDVTLKYLLDLRVTPQTIVVGPRGTVMGSWSGMLQENDVKAVQALLG